MSIETPVPVTNLDLAFGGKMNELLPPMSEIPDEFKHSYNNKWVDAVSTWFYKGLENGALKPKDGVDSNLAMRHVAAIMCSFEPQHEHKTAGCAYLLSKWFDDYTPSKK